MSTPILPDPGDTGSAAAQCSVSANWPSPDCRVLDQLLALARHYLQSGLRRQAMDIFWSLIHRHAPTTQARSARADLLRLARQYETEGMTQIARDIVERLLAAGEGDQHAGR